MQGIHGKNLIVVQKGTIGAFEVGQGYKTNLVGRLLECVQVKRMLVLDEDKSPYNPCHFCAIKLYSVYQLDYVVLPKPFKHGFKQAFDFYTSNVLMKQLQHSTKKDV